MANLLDKAKVQLSNIPGQFSSIQGTATDTLLAAKSGVQETTGKIQGQFNDLLNTAGSTTRDIKDQAEASASSTAETAKTEANNIAAFFAGILEKCCAPFSKKKD